MSALHKGFSGKAGLGTRASCGHRSVTSGLTTPLLSKQSPLKGWTWVEMTGHEVGTDTLAFFLLHVLVLPQSMMPSGPVWLLHRTSAMVSSWSAVVPCLVPFVPGVQREEKIPRSSEMEGAAFGFLQRLRSLVGLVWFGFWRTALFTCLYFPRVGSNLRLCACSVSMLRTELCPSPSDTILNWFLGFATGEASESKLCGRGCLSSFLMSHDNGRRLLAAYFLPVAVTATRISCDSGVPGLHRPKLSTIPCPGLVLLGS